MKNKLIILILMLFAFVVNVDAISLKPTGSTTANLGGTLKVYIALERSTREETISAVDGLISWDSDVLTLSNQKVLLSGWTKLSEVSNGKKFAYGNLTLDNLITETSSNIVELTFIVNNSAKSGNTVISISSANAVDSNYKDNSLNKEIHTIKIGATPSSINTLSSLKIDGKSVENFDSKKYSYNVSVSNSVSSITISSTLSDSDASYVEGYGNRKVDLKVGNNEVLVKVKAENGDIKTYTLKVNRTSDSKSSVNTLKTLILSDGKINFNSNTTTYNVSVANNVSSITISSTLTNSKSSYVEGYGNRTIELKEGNNEILLKVKAENDDIKTYILNVIREKKQMPLVKNIEVKGYDVNFDNSVKEYNLEIKNEKSLEFNIVLNDNQDNYEIIGNDNLNDGKVITIRVTGDNQVEEYLFNITTLQVANLASNLSWIVGIATIVFIILGFGVVYLNKINKNGKLIDKN